MSSHVCSGKIMDGGMVIRFERSSSKSNKTPKNSLSISNSIRYKAVAIKQEILQYTDKHK